MLSQTSPTRGNCLTAYENTRLEIGENKIYIGIRKQVAYGFSEWVREQTKCTIIQAPDAITIRFIV